MSGAGAMQQPRLADAAEESGGAARPPTRPSAARLIGPVDDDSLPTLVSRWTVAPPRCQRRGGVASVAGVARTHAPSCRNPPLYSHLSPTRRKPLRVVPRAVPSPSLAKRDPLPTRRSPAGPTGLVISRTVPVPESWFGTRRVWPTAGAPAKADQY
ncbi:hypothetical protein MRX96_001887 [Rhipicephalus microplus]